jgi:hypothetical protein
MQDSTAESIKSLEGFDIAWVEEASVVRVWVPDLQQRVAIRRRVRHVRSRDGRFSTRNCWPSRSDGAISLAVMSVKPPGAKPTSR